MVKLSRIVKKSLSNSSLNADNLVNNNIVKESYASKGKSQPTIDFTNLPSFDELKFDSNEFKTTSSHRRNRNLLKVNKNNKFKSKTTKNTRDNLRSKVYLEKDNDLYEKNKLSRENKSKLLNLNNENEDQKDDFDEKNNKEEVKLVERLNIMSRGKRKRELKKESWRRKNEFRKEAKRIIDEFTKEVKHGKALGNLTGMKGQLDLMEESMRKSMELASKKNKKKSKLTKKDIIKSRRLFNVATKNI